MNATAERSALHLNPGELLFAGEGQRIHTLLGSCVSLTVWHRAAACGGICHAIVPTRAGQGRHDAGWYADEAPHVLMRRASLLAPLQQLEFKLFGGGRLFDDEGLAGPSIGERNVRRMRDLLAAQGVPTASEHVGGSGWRTIVFDLADGSVRVRHSIPGAGSVEWTG